MTLPVHLAPSLDGVTVGSTVTVEGDEAHHAVVVRRLRVGEPVVLTDGRGSSVRGAVAETGKGRFTVTVTAVDFTAPAEPSFAVVQALPKGDRGELAVELLTEIGVSSIVPWAASRSVAVWKGDRSAKSLAKWRATAREAAKQSRRSWFPEVESPATTSEVAALLSSCALALVLHEEADTPLSSVPVPASGLVAVVVGPEGGLTDEEVSTLEAAGAIAVRLGPEVLRTSTAGVAAVASLMAQTPRWG